MRVLFPSFIIAPFILILWGFGVGLLLWGTGVDVALQRWLWVNYNHDMNQIMRFLGDVGKGSSEAAMCLVGAGVWQWRAAGSLMVRNWLKGPLLLAAALPVFWVAGLLNLLVKMFVGRPRPKYMLMNGGNPFDVQPFSDRAMFWSFPSGHACSTFAIAVWLMLLFPRYQWFFLGAAVVLSGSRFLAVTPHYLGDVVAGAALGAAVAWGLFGWYEQRGKA